jgi:hypothetical protein
MFRLLALVLIALPFAALAQVGVPSYPTIANGFGSLSVSGSSINVSTVTAGPGSNTWVMPLFGNLVIQNVKTSAGAVYVCPKGGVCTSANGWPLQPGDVGTWALGGTTTSPTIIAATTATVMVGW